MSAGHMKRVLDHVVKRSLPWGIYKTDHYDQRAWVVFRARTRKEAIDEYHRLMEWKRPGEHYRVREDY